MALFLTVLVLVLLFTAGLTLWCRRKRWRPVAALLMLLPMAICGNVMFSVVTSYSTTEMIARRVDPGVTGPQEARRGPVEETESRVEVNRQAAAFVAGMGVLFVLGLLAWSVMFLAWLLRRLRPRTPEVPG